MPITRTPIIDDDGSGTTGTVIDFAWKDELYDQIDAATGDGPPIAGSFTPTDLSGAGLAIGTIGGFYLKIGRLVFVTMHILYPSTASGATAQIGGLPYAVAVGHNFSLYQGFGALQLRTWNNTGTSLLVLDAVTGAYKTNLDLSGSNTTWHGVYMTA